MSYFRAAKAPLACALLSAHCSLDTYGLPTPTTGSESVGTGTSVTTTGTGTGDTTTGTTTDEPTTTGAMSACAQISGDNLNSRGFPNGVDEVTSNLVLTRDPSKPMDPSPNRILAGMQIYNPCAVPATIDFGQPTQTGPGQRSGTVASYTLDLDHIATNSLIKPLAWAAHIAVDKSGNIYILGRFGDAVDIPTDLYKNAAEVQTVMSPAPDQAGAWIAVYSPEGTLKHTSTALSASAATVWPNRIDVSEDGSFRVTGWLEKNQDQQLTGIFSGDECNVAQSLRVGFLASFPDVSAMPKLSCVAPADGYMNFYASARVPDGRVAAVGVFKGTVSVGDDGDVASAGGYDAIAVVFDAEGSPIWHGSLGGPGDEGAQAIAAGPAGELLIAGGDASPADNKTGPTTAFVQVLKMGPMGAEGTQFTDTRALIQPDGASSVFNSIGTDACGSVVVAGYTAGSVKWNAENDPPVDGNDSTNNSIFVAKLDPTLKPVWSKRLTSEGGNGAALSFAIAPSGEIYVGGGYGGAVTVPPFGHWEQTAPICPETQNNDAFLLSLAP